MFKLQLGGDCYRIEAPDGEVGDEVEYGDLAEVLHGGKRYVALVDLMEGAEGEHVSLLGDDWVIEAGPVQVEVVDVDFTDDEDEDEGDGAEDVPVGVDDEHGDAD